MYYLSPHPIRTISEMPEINILNACMYYMNVLKHHILQKSEFKGKSSEMTDQEHHPVFTPENTASSTPISISLHLTVKHGVKTSTTETVV